MAHPNEHKLHEAEYTLGRSRSKTYSERTHPKTVSFSRYLLLNDAFNIWDPILSKVNMILMINELDML
jgi:hypothetical protein